MTVAPRKTSGFFADSLSDGVDHDLATTFSKPRVHGERRWHDKPKSHKTAFDDNHDRVTSAEGQALLRRRGEVGERPSLTCVRRAAVAA